MCQPTLTPQEPGTSLTSTRYIIPVHTLAMHAVTIICLSARKMLLHTCLRVKHTALGLFFPTASLHLLYHRDSSAMELAYISLSQAGCFGSPEDHQWYYKACLRQPGLGRLNVVCWSMQASACLEQVPRRLPASVSLGQAGLQRLCLFRRCALCRCQSCTQLQQLSGA